MAKRAKKPKLGRPSLGDAALRSFVGLKITEAERAQWERMAGDLSLSEWLRGAAEARFGAPVARIEVSPDDGDHHWVAYDSESRPLSCGALAAGPNLEKRARKAAEEHGLVGVSDTEVIVETP